MPPLATDLSATRPERLDVPGPPPGGREAPIEFTGRRRDAARLLVAWRSSTRLVDTTFADIPRFLDPGDIVVVNTSATLPAAVPIDDERMLHLSTELSDGTWLVELRHRAGDGTRPWGRSLAPAEIHLPAGGRVDLLAPFAASGGLDRLWVARLHLPGGVRRYLARHGRPIRYGTDPGAWPLAAYQTVFGTEPGSAEMPSASRGFTPEVVTRLVSKGVVVAPIILHTGVSSLESGEPPYPERYDVPATTAELVNGARMAGHRVVAAGTTVTRALETVAGPHGRIRPGKGWTDLMITPERGVWVVDGLITGWHEPEASHLLLIEAVAGRRLLRRSYAAAAELGYAWHQFGDLHLVLP